MAASTGDGIRPQDGLVSTVIPPRLNLQEFQIGNQRAHDLSVPPASSLKQQHLTAALEVPPKLSFVSIAGEEKVSGATPLLQIHRFGRVQAHMPNRNDPALANYPFYVLCIVDTAVDGHSRISREVALSERTKTERCKDQRTRSNAQKSPVHGDSLPRKEVLHLLHKHVAVHVADGLGQG
jgi:hypothetical protein